MDFTLRRHEIAWSKNLRERSIIKGNISDIKSA
jgi:hypothetical protein